MSLDRRSFLKGSALAGGAVALGALTGCSPSGNNFSESGNLPKGTLIEDFRNSVVVIDPITKFLEEKTYDIVVVGAGTAGVPAVCAALEEGVSVACLQKESIVIAHGGGSSGIILDECNAMGILQYKYAWAEAIEFRHNPDLLQAFIEQSGECAFWMVKNGHAVGLPPTSTRQRREFDAGNICVALSNNFGPKPINNQNIMTLLAEKAEKDGAHFYYKTPAVQLVTASNGAVTGVIGETDKGYIKFNANKGVIIAAGDYQNNRSLEERYCPDTLRFQKKQVNKTGDGILMSMLVGAVMTPVHHSKTMHDMDAAGSPMTAFPFMALDSKGERFMNENIPMHCWDMPLRRRKDTAADPGRFWRIFDSEYQSKYNTTIPVTTLENYIPGLIANPPGVYPDLRDVHRANTLDELARALGIPADGLKKSVDKWNSYCASGKDEQFGVLKDKMKPIDKPPYWGIRQWIRLTAINSGIEINKDYQVVDKDGKVIKGLYAAGSVGGDVCGGLEWNMYQGGFTCGAYMTMGRYAAIHAVKGNMTPSKPVKFDEIKGYLPS
ncbi:MAG: FAD-binding protein [Eggerthellaceae bacterium]|nr:FAD-binding protein [Eggerthellaceae bacterium]